MMPKTKLRPRKMAGSLQVDARPLLATSGRRESIQDTIEDPEQEVHPSDGPFSQETHKRQVASAGALLPSRHPNGKHLESNDAQSVMSIRSSSSSQSSAALRTSRSAAVVEAHRLNARFTDVCTPATKIHVDAPASLPSTIWQPVLSDPFQFTQESPYVPVHSSRPRAESSKPRTSTSSSSASDGVAAAAARAGADKPVTAIRGKDVSSSNILKTCPKPGSISNLLKATTATSKDESAQNKTLKRKIAPDSKSVIVSKVPRIRDISVPVFNDRTAPKDACCDQDGHFIVRVNMTIASRFNIIQQLGQGTFGKVVQCYDKRRKRHCAVKIIRSTQKYRDASLVEIRALKTISQHDPNNLYKCIHMDECFDYRKHICIVTELLGRSVFDFLKSNKYIPFPKAHILSFAKQLITSVQCLIHTDLKPENVLLVDDSYITRSMDARPGLDYKVLNNPEIRLIDFGSATFTHEYHASVVSTRHYRAPEVIMGIGWSYPCDMWSIGCILLELFTGRALFQTHDNLEHLAMMEIVCGKMDMSLVKSATADMAKLFCNGNLQYARKKSPKAKEKPLDLMKTLDDLVPPSECEFNECFNDFLKRLLIYDPKLRLTAKEALSHKLLSLEIDAPDLELSMIPSITQRT